MTEPRLLLTRPRAQAERFANALRMRFGTDFDAVLSPVLEIAFVPFKATATTYDGLIFTSRHGLDGYHAGGGTGTDPAWCVGPATAQAATEAGYAVQAAASNLSDLAEHLRPLPATKHLLHPRGTHVAGDLAEMLAGRGPEISEIVVYDQQPRPLNKTARALLDGTAPVLLPVFSPRSAKLICDEAAGASAKLYIAAMSPAVAAELPVQAAAGIAIAPTPSAEGMLQALSELLAGLRCA